MTVAQERDCVLCINGGSATIKFALYTRGAAMKRTLSGKIDRIGLPGMCLSFRDTVTRRQEKVMIDDDRTAPAFLIDWLAQRIDLSCLKAVGHRVVHGMHYDDHQMISSSLLEELRRHCEIDPDHLPGEIDMIDAIVQRYPQLPQVACFDTVFHRTMTREASMLPLPHRFQDRGMRRYGFHGLSYAYLLERLAHIGEGGERHGRMVLAHLGSGASMAAIRDGRSIDTSMGFTPAGGLTMGTRTGDLDPGVACYLMQTEKITAAEFNSMVNRESGLLGISGISADMRDLLALETTNSRAADAVALFCYRAKKCIGAYAAALGGLDALVFSGGIGENTPAARARICAGLEFLGIEIAKENNLQNSVLISTASSRVAVRVLHTDEEMMIARSVLRILKLPIPDFSFDEEPDHAGIDQRG